MSELSQPGGIIILLYYLLLLWWGVFSVFCLFFITCNIELRIGTLKVVSFYT